MKKTLLVLTVVIVAAGMAAAQDKGLHGSVDLTYQSKYIWRGIDVFNDHSAIQPSVDLDLWGTGFGVSAMGHRANASGFEEVVPGAHSGERWDYTLYYQNGLFKDERHALNYRLGWVYYNFPENYAADYDLQELHAVLSWPTILPVKGLVPSYVLIKLWPSSQGSIVGGAASGFAHVFMLDYPVTVGGLVPNKPEQVFRLHSEVVYNDGVDPRGAGVDHDWSNAVFGVATDFDCGKNMTLTPAVYHQVTMDRSVNPDKDETWATLGLKYKF